MTLLRIALADLKLMTKDRMAVIWLLVMPMLMAFVFGSALRGGGERDTWIPVVNLDRHELSSMFVDALRGAEYNIDVKGPQELQGMKSWAPYVVVIPAGFGDSILRGERVKIPLLKGDTASDKFMEVQAHLLETMVRFTRGLLIADVSHHPWNAGLRSSLTNALARPQLLTVTRRSYHTLRPPPSGFSQSLPGMLVMFVMQMVLTYGGISLIHDRMAGRLRRLFAAPLHPMEAYVGKTLGRMGLACAQAGLLLGFGAVAFHQPLGDHPVYLIPVVLSLACVAGCMSVFAGMLCQTEKQMHLVAIFGSMAFAALGGCWWPIEIAPQSFKTIASLTPNYWAMHGLQSVLYFGRDKEVLWLDCPVLLGFAAVFGLAALLAGRWGAGRSVTAG